MSSKPSKQAPWLQMNPPKTRLNVSKTRGLRLATSTQDKHTVGEMAIQTTNEHTELCMFSLSNEPQPLSRNLKNALHARRFQGDSMKCF